MELKYSLFTQLFLACALAACAAHARKPKPEASMAPPEVTTEADADDRYPPSPARFGNGVTGIPGLTYSALSGYRPLELDLYLPPEFAGTPAAGFPLVVFLHGDAWLYGDRRHSPPFADFPALLASLAGRGYVVASIDYRLSGEAHYPAQIQDVKMALRWLRTKASAYKIDPARVATWGVSAGAHLAGLAAASCGQKDLEPPPAVRPGSDALEPPPAVTDCVQGAVAWYGPLDMTSLEEQARAAQAEPRDKADAPEWRLLGCPFPKCSQRELENASPAHFVTPKTAPMLLVTGNDDRTVPYQQTLEMAEKLAANGVPHRLVVIPGVGHALVGKSLGQTADANLRALDATFRFLDETLGRNTP